MMKEMTVENMEKELNNVFAEIDALTDSLFQGIEHSLKQIEDSYKESKEQY